MEQSPSWEANRFSASQVISPHIMEAEGSLSHSQEPDTCPYSQSDQSSPCPPSHVLMIHFNNVLPCTSGPSKWSLSLGFPYQNPVCASPLPHTCNVPRQSHSSRFDYSNNNWWGVQIIQFPLMQSFRPPITASLLGPKAKSHVHFALIRNQRINPIPRQLRTFHNMAIFYGEEYERYTYVFYSENLGVGFEVSRRGKVMWKWIFTK
jgi:hypothetical protein